MNDLRAAQHWMLDAILTGATGNAGDRIRSTTALPASARLDIYARSYVGRLLAHLRASFPLLRALTGPQVFDLFAHGYIQAHPPTGHGLADYGADLPAFLDATQPSVATDATALPAAVARLDLLRRD